MKFKLALSLLLLALGTASLAQTYPVKPVRLLVPFPAGGATDILARALSQKLGEKLGQTVVVENRPGAGGTIGADAAAKASPDGYTLLLATSSTHSIGPAINPRIPYNATTDFTPIVYVASSPNIVLVPNSSPVKTMREFIDYARKNPGRLNYASSGNGTIVHLSTEYFKAASDTFILHIPYRGTALAMPDLKARLSGQGTEPSYLAPAEFRSYMAAEQKRWTHTLGWKIPPGEGARTSTTDSSR